MAHAAGPLIPWWFFAGGCLSTVGHTRNVSYESAFYRTSVVMSLHFSLTDECGLEHEFSHLLWRHFSFPPVIPFCYCVPSHPVFLGNLKKGQEICCNLLIASGFFPNSETSVTLKGFMHLIEGKIERPSPHRGFRWKTSWYTKIIRTRMRVL